MIAQLNWLLVLQIWGPELRCGNTWKPCTAVRGYSVMPVETEGDRLLGIPLQMVGPHFSPPASGQSSQKTRTIGQFRPLSIHTWANTCKCSRTHSWGQTAPSRQGHPRQGVWEGEIEKTISGHFTVHQWWFCCVRSVSQPANVFFIKQHSSEWLVHKCVWIWFLSHQMCLLKSIIECLESEEQLVSSLEYLAGRDTAQQPLASCGRLDHNTSELWTPCIQTQVTWRNFNSVIISII